MNEAGYDCRRRLLPTGKVRRCLNLGSYNYLGFADTDEFCTPRVLDSLDALGWATSSPRTEAGERQHRARVVVKHRQDPVW